MKKAILRAVAIWVGGSILTFGVAVATASADPPHNDHQSNNSAGNNGQGGVSPSHRPPGSQKGFGWDANGGSPPTVIHLIMCSQGNGPPPTVIHLIMCSQGNGPQ